MTIDAKIRLGLLAVSLAVPAVAALAAAHGLFVGHLYGSGPGPWS